MKRQKSPKVFKSKRPGALIVLSFLPLLTKTCTASERAPWAERSSLKKVRRDNQGRLGEEICFQGLENKR